MIETVSVIVPSRARSAKLGNLASALARQAMPGGVALELVVAVDGEGEPAGLPGSLPGGGACRLLREPFVGISDARNRAIAASSGELLVVVNDDIVPEPGFIAAHVRAHERLGAGGTPGGVTAVVGDSPWRAWDEPVAFDAFVAHSPAIFDRGALERCGGEPLECRLGFRSAWGLNVSFRRAVLEPHGEAYCAALRPIYYDDIEFAHRVLAGGDAAAGCAVFEPGARAEHDHRVGVREYFWREAMLGVMSRALFEANRACYEAILPLDPAAHAARARAMVETDERDHARLLGWFGERAGEAWDGEGASGRAIGRDLFAAHLPLKRRAFRVGLLLADAEPGTAWQERPGLATRAIEADPVFGVLSDVPGGR